MNLFIVESPAKAKTIGQYLGNEYSVIASMGHIRELIPKNGSIEVDNNFKMHFQIIEKSKQQVKKICDLAKKANKIYLASDPDREGEAISQAIYDILIEKKVAKPEQFYRVAYNEITKNAILNALKNTRQIDKNLVEAQKARQSLDYLVGFNLSPVLWRKLPGSRSAGRVQSVALRMIVDREFEIKKFKPEEYWTINCDLNTNKNEKILARVVKYNDKVFDVNFPKDKKNTLKIEDDIRRIGGFSVIKNETKDVKQNPYPPFTTSLLQQDASKKLGFSSKKTMSLAQKLYEGVNINGKTIALITYMRTDGMTISNDAIVNIRSVINEKFGSQYLPDKAIIYKTKAKNAQEAHEAIRPTHIDIAPEKIENSLDGDMWKLYNLIWKRTIACQMKPAIFSRQTIDLLAKYNENKILARLNGSLLKFNGYLAVYNVVNNNSETDDEDNEDKIIPKLNVGDFLNVNNVISEQHFTNPPARYTEASLIKTLESYGIGRPSTYATIISVLQDREYVCIEKKQFIPSSRGIVVCVFLKQFFLQYVEYDFTAKIEEDLDYISNGDLERVEFLTKFWKNFHKNINEVMNEDFGNIFKKLNDVFLEYFIKEEEKRKCPKCGGTISLKSSKTGCFFGCNNYPNCKYAISLDNIENDKENNINENSNENLIFKTKLYGDVCVKKGPYGRYCEYNKEGKIKRISIPEDNITNEVIDFYLSLPKKLGNDNEGNEIITNIGRFGPYLLCNKRFYSYKEKPYYLINLEKAITIIERENNKKANFKKVIKKGKRDENEEKKTKSKIKTKKKISTKKEKK